MCNALYNATCLFRELQPAKIGPFSLFFLTLFSVIFATLAGRITLFKILQKWSKISKFYHIKWNPLMTTYLTIFWFSWAQEITIFRSNSLAWPNHKWGSVRAIICYTPQTLWVALLPNPYSWSHSRPPHLKRWSKVERNVGIERSLGISLRRLRRQGRKHGSPATPTHSSCTPPRRRLWRRPAGQSFARSVPLVSLTERPFISTNFQSELK